MKRHSKTRVYLACAVLPALAFSVRLPVAGQTTTTTFSAGAEGWVGPAGAPGTGTSGGTTIQPTGGNPADHAFVSFSDFFFSYRNSTNPDFVRDLTPYTSVQVSVDVKVDAIDVFGSPVSRPLVLDFRDFDNTSSYPWDSVWFDLGPISASTHGDWTTMSVIINDPDATELPPGWRGYGASDSSFMSVLPAGRTFADILAGYDEIAFQTIDYDNSSLNVDFNVRFDNISIALVPEPGSFALLGLGGLCLAKRRLCS